MTYIERRNVKRYTATGTIDPNYSLHALSGSSAITMTLVNPDSYRSGAEIEVVCTTAKAHVLTVSGGFGGDTDRVTYTFRGNINDSTRLVALDGYWYILDQTTGSFDLTQNYDASGAIDPTYELHSLDKAGVGAMTLATATADMEGRRMTISSSTAQAHTVTYTPGFAGASTAGDVATFGGAIGDSISLVVIDGVWHITGVNNVTIA